MSFYPLLQIKLTTHGSKVIGFTASPAVEKLPQLSWW